LHAKTEKADSMHEEDENERICSTLQWKDVRLPSAFTETELDALIFSFVDQRWRKTLRIVGCCFERCEAQSIRLPMEAVAARLQALADAGKIETAGSLWMWRNSEVRLKTD
jgi:hypothetical protein